MSTPGPLIILLFGLVVFVSHVLEGITGFGSTALSLPFVAVMLGIGVAKPVLMLYTMPLCIFILCKTWRCIQWRHFARMMGMLALGLPLGILLYDWLPQKPLLGLLAAFMVVVSVRGLLLAFGVLKQKRAMRDGVALAMVFLGGIIHGAFSSGGPLVILYSAEKIPDKTQFRATMCAIWLTLNIVLLAQIGFAGQLSSEVWRMGLWGAPFLVAGTLLGDWLHSKVKAELFTKLTYAILLVSGVFMAVNLFV